MRRFPASKSALLAFALLTSVVSSAAADPGLQLNQFLYRTGDSVTAVLDFFDGAGNGERGRAGIRLGSAVMLVGEQQGDVELLALRNGAGNVSTATGCTVVTASEPMQRNDGRLQLAPGERFFAYVFWQSDARPRASVAVGTSRSPNGPNVRIEAALGRVAQLGTDGQSGVLAGSEGAVEIATDHFIYHPRSDTELRRLLRATRGRIIRPGNAAGVVAIGIDPMALYAGALAPVLAFMQAKESVVASSERSAALFAAVLSLQLQGFRVAVDPALQWHGPPYAAADQAVGGGVVDYLADGGSLALSMLPGMRESWVYSWLFELDRKRVNVAFVDSGFAPNYDFRGLDTNHIWQCDFANHEPSDPTACVFAGSNGPATAPQAVGNSFFGGKSWHGTGVVTAAVGLLNNGYGGVGAAGQVGVPMLYRTDLRTYALQFSDTIRKAAIDGASVINISAGYPCRIFKVEAAPYEICNAAGRAQLLHDLWASAVSLAGTVCGPFAPICLGVAGYYASDFVDIIAEAGATDLREILTHAVADVNQRGAVVVASAGNLMTNGVACAIVDCGNHDADAYQLIPCVINGVICVGALGGSPGAYQNLHYKGASVDFYAPSNHTYVRPVPDDLPAGDPIPPLSQHEVRCCITATSSAAPVVAGIVALIEAAQPTLHNGNTQLSAAEIAAIPERIRSILDATAVQQMDVVDSALLLKIISPYAALSAAIQGSLPDANMFAGPDWARDPDVAAAGSCGTNEDPTAPNVVLSFGQTCGGSIVAVTPQAGGSAVGIHREDVDVTAWQVPADGRYRTTISVTTPARSLYGYVGINGSSGVPSGVNSDGSETFTYATLPHFAGQVVPFKVGGVRDSDNLYRLTIGVGEKLAELAPDRFDTAATHPLQFADNDTADTAAPVGIGMAPADADGWETIDSRGNKRMMLNNLNFHDASDIDWLTIRNIPSDAARDCGSVLSVNAPDDIRVNLYASYAIGSSPTPIDAHLNHASLRFRPGALPPRLVGVALESDSHAALEYSASIQLWFLNRVVCNFDRTAIVVPHRPGVRWPLAARPLDRAGRPVAEAAAPRPVILFFEHPGGALHVTGRLVAGRSFTAELADANGRRVWLREIDSSEIVSTAKGGSTLDVAENSRPAGTYYLILRSNDPLAEVEVGPMSPRFQ
jgi:hypothetical protein